MKMRTQSSKLSSFFTENISDSSNSMEDLSNDLTEIGGESNDLTEIEDILLFIKEEETILLMIDESICGCKCCLIDRLKQAYQEACEELNLYQQTSNMEHEAVEHWFNNFKERYKHEIASFPFRCEDSFEKQSILTHEQEQSLLKDAQENTTKTDCICQECILREVSYLAYKLASNKNIPYPESWKRDKKAGLRWLKDFKVKHEAFLSFFPSICKITSFFTEVLKPLNSSRERIRKHNVPIKIKDILLFTKEEEILKWMMDNIQSVCGCKYCLMDHLKKVYQEAREELLYPQSNNEAIENWFKNFEERYKDEISIFPIRCGRSEESITKQQSILSIEEELSLLTQIKANSTTEDCICQECLLKEVASLAYKVAFDNKKSYPESWKKHKRAESQWLKNFTERHKNEISNFPSRCKLSEEAITKQQSIFSVEEELSLLTQIKEKNSTEDCICQECLLTEISFLVYKVASYNNIPCPESWKKYKKAESQWMKDFIERHKNEISKFPLICKLISEETINAQWSSKVIFTFVQERSLLVDLEANSTKEDCICQKCVLEKLPFLVYKLACDVNLKNRAKQFPKSWNRCKKAGQHWMEDFIKRHEKEFAKLSFPCKINPSEPSTSKGQSSLN